MVLAPVSVTAKPPALGPAALNRRLLVVLPLIGVVLGHGRVVPAAPCVVGVAPPAEVSGDDVAAAVDAGPIGAGHGCPAAEERCRGVGRVDVAGCAEPGVKSTVPPELRVMAPSRKPVLLVLPLVVTTTAEPPERTVVPLKACEVPLLLAASLSASAPPPNCSA